MTRTKFFEMKQLSKEADAIYNSPINTTIGAFHDQLVENYEDQVMKAVCRIGIDIDKQALIAALNQDRRRYEEAYRAGYSAAQQEYQDRMMQIAKLTGVYLESEE